MQSIPKPPRAEKPRISNARNARAMRRKHSAPQNRFAKQNFHREFESSGSIQSAAPLGTKLRLDYYLLPSPLVQGANRSTASAGFPSLMGRDGRDYTRGRREISTLARVYALPLREKREKRKARVIERGEEEGIDESAIPDI